MTKLNNVSGHRFSSKSNIVLLAFLLIAAYFLVTEHWAHVIQFLPYTLLLVCVGMHFFMRGGHNHGGGSPADDDDPIDAFKMRR
ncbi:MAG: DUF2933 domain-containing protein [Gammaproteobacteria bacterium]|nr:DUF2933 domain-containing protein [Gammaproteobacteria bacterium]